MSNTPGGARFAATTLVVALASIGVAGCRDSTAPSKPAPPATDAIRLVSMSPDSGTILAPAQTVTFSGTVNYTLGTADSGSVLMVIEDQNFAVIQPTGTQPRARVAAGQRDVSMSQTLTLPPAGITAVNVFFPLVPKGATSTKTVAFVSYPVSSGPIAGPLWDHDDLSHRRLVH